MFVLYEQYGVAKVDGQPALDLTLTEQAIAEAFAADSATLGNVINQEIAFHQPLVPRDHPSRIYVQMLTRVLGISVNLAAVHDAQMRAALAQATPPQRPALDMSKIIAKDG